MARLRIEAGQKLVFIGDSNTDTEYRTRAVPYGYGYVMMCHAFLEASHPGMGLTFVNRGNDGDTILDLERRWQSDVLDEQPDWLFVMIGTNDAGYRFLPEYHDRAVDDATFAATLRTLLARTREATRARIALVEPPVFELEVDSEPNCAIGRLCELLDEVGREYDCESVPVFESMAQALANGHAEGWFQNVNHPYFPGHAFIAQQVLRCIGWTFPGGE